VIGSSGTEPAEIVVAGDLGQFHDGRPAQFGDAGGDVCDVAGLVGPAAAGDGCEIGRVGLDQEAVEWNLTGDLAQGGGGLESRVRYDNERGKGDHRHLAGREDDYAFTTVEQLLADFRRDIENWSSP